jgi:succinate-acetate transporter protein
MQGAVTTITAGEPTLDFTATFAMFYGGLIQLLAGMWEMWKNNTFAATAFSSYGAQLRRSWAPCHRFL